MLITIGAAPIVGFLAVLLGAAQVLCGDCDSQQVGINCIIGAGRSPAIVGVQSTVILVRRVSFDNVR